MHSRCHGVSEVRIWTREVRARAREVRVEGVGGSYQGMPSGMPLRPAAKNSPSGAEVYRRMSRSILLKLLGGTNSSHALRRWINFWPPFLGAGIRVKHIAPDMKAIDVEMKLRWWNANYVGTHFGGSLFAMTDAFYMLMLMANLGRDYIVWDKAASIRYRKPGKGTVRAEFRLTDAQLDDIREKLKTLPKYEPTFQVEVKDESGEVVSRCRKVIARAQEGSATSSLRRREAAKDAAHSVSCGTAEIEPAAEGRKKIRVHPRTLPSTRPCRRHCVHARESHSRS